MEKCRDENRDVKSEHDQNIVDRKKSTHTHIQTHRGIHGSDRAVKLVKRQQRTRQEKRTYFDNFSGMSFKRNA